MMNVERRDRRIPIGFGMKDDTRLPLATREALTRRIIKRYLLQQRRIASIT